MWELVAGQHLLQANGKGMMKSQAKALLTELDSVTLGWQRAVLCGGGTTTKLSEELVNNPVINQFPTSVLIYIICLSSSCQLAHDVAVPRSIKTNTSRDFCKVSSSEPGWCVARLTVKS